MANRIAILDLGTNTFHLLIVETKDRKVVKELTRDYAATKLGEGGITDGIITETAFNRGITALIEFKKTIDFFAVNTIKATGTAALRTAKNGHDFVRAVLLKTGIQIEIIDGDAEAEYIWHGVRNAVSLNSSTSLIMDIGGGSVEFICCNDTQVFWKKSYPLGAAKLMALFHHTDPISREEIDQLIAHFDNHFADLKSAVKKHQPTKLIGSAGSFETFATLEVIHFKLEETRLEQTFFDFSISQLLEVLEKIIVSTHLERAGNAAIPPVRTDMIVVASVLTKYIINNFKFTAVQLSANALKEGVLAKMLIETT